MGILLQPGHVFLCPFWTCPGHQFVRSPEGLRQLLCREATLVQVEKLAGLAQDVFNLHQRSEEHTSELQSLRHLVCRLLLEKKKKSKSVYFIYVQNVTAVVPTQRRACG